MSHIAASIRVATESETFDLAGQNAATIENMVRDAFGEALPLDKMIRLTFVTGAGKLGRQKYDEGAAKALTATLRDMGFEDDRGASAVLECAGSFKLQHDTGKNLKTVVVFPRVTGGGAETTGEAMGKLSLDGAQEESLIPEDTPEHKLAYSSMNIFERNISSKCQTWSEKKACLARLESIKETVQSLENKLMTGTPLTEVEQACYDAVSISSLEEKQTHVRDLMHKQVANGMLTASEKITLLHQVTERLENLTKDIAEAEKQGKKKRVENLTAVKAKAQDRKTMLENVTPKPAPPLKNEEEIGRLRRELAPLEEIEAKAQGRLLTLKESQAVSRKEELMEDILEQEELSRGWFESDEDFLARIERSRTNWAAQKRTLKKKKPAAKSAPAASKWSTPAPRSRVASNKTRKSKPASGGGLFAAMMADSDSD